jgi:hypothetical protein
MAINSDNNPYAAPAVLDNIPEPPAPPGFINKAFVLQAAWMLAVLLNLPVPVMLGESAVSDPRAMVGMPLGIAAVYLPGIWLCLKRAGLMWRLIVGSSITALFQFYPIPHMLIGMIAMGISQVIFDPHGTTRDISSLPEATLVTILTGIGLIIPSLLMGTALFAAFRIKVFDVSSDKHPIQARSASE